jgi:hypothetical protein
LLWCIRRLEIAPQKKVKMIAHQLLDEPTPQVLGIPSPQTASSEKFK